MTTQSNTLPLNQLRIDEKANVRSDHSIDPVLLASIKAIGVLDPLHVRPNGKGYVVHAGGQRLLALQALAKTGDIAADAAVPVIIDQADDATAREISLAENVARRAMHPVDEFRAFAALHSDKTKPLDVEAIASRFGVNIKIVRQRLALGALDDLILDAWLKDDLNEEDAQAFTLQPDKKQQAAIFAKLKKNRELYPGAIRAAIKAGQSNVKAMLESVGVKNYEKAGGTITKDLFGDDVVVSDYALLQKMIDTQIFDLAEQAKMQGWGFVETERPQNYYEYGRLEIPFKPTKDEKAKLDKLASKADGGDDDAYDKHEALTAEITRRGLTPELKAKAGIRITWEGNGVTIAEAIVKPNEKKTNQPAIIVEKKKKSTAGLTKALTDRLTEQRLKGIKTAIVTHPHATPFAATLAAIIASQIDPPSPYHSAPRAISDKYNVIIAGIAPKVMNEAMRKAFDAKDYFEACGKAHCLAAITEAVNADESRKISKGKRGEIAKFALTNVGKTKWLPKELRTAHYDGPQTKTKGKTKPKAKK